MIIGYCRNRPPAEGGRIVNLGERFTLPSWRPEGEGNTLALFVFVSVQLSWIMVIIMGLFLGENGVGIGGNGTDGSPSTVLQGISWIYSICRVF